MLTTLIVFAHLVTVNNDCTGCTCGLDRSFLVRSHVLTVEVQELAPSEEASRAYYVEAFGIYE